MDIVTNDWIVLLGVLCVLLAGISGLYMRHKKVRFQRYLAGITRLKQLCLLLVTLQQHRGLCNGYLNGDKTLIRQITEIQRKVHQSREAINQPGCWALSSSVWQGVQDHWGRLSAGYAGLDSVDCISQHNQMISHMLYLIEDCAQAHRLQELELPGHGSSIFLWQELLTMVEFIGQARALGTGVVAAGHCDSVNRIRLNFIHSKLSSTQEYVDAERPAAALKSLLSTLRQEVILEKPLIGVAEYFDQASAVIELLMDEFNSKLDLLGRQIQAR